MAVSPSPSITACKNLVDANRIDFYAPADFRAGHRLEKRVRTILDLIVARISLERERREFLTAMRKD